MAGRNMSETTQLPLSIEPGEIVYRDRNQTIQRVVARFTGFEKEFFVSDHGQRAALMAVKNGKVLLVKQYRLLVNGISYEIPGGRIEEGETPEAAAGRECFEETGIRCTNLKPLFAYQPGLDILKNQTHIFYSENIEETKESADRRAWEPLKSFNEKIFSHKIMDSMTIMAYFAYEHEKSGGKP
jgi:ADP-ribose pyrophosphatase